MPHQSPSESENQPLICSDKSGKSCWLYEAECYAHSHLKLLLDMSDL